MTTFDAQKMTEVQAKLIPFLGNTGVVIELAEPRHVKLRMPFEPNVNHVGIMYAGALFTLAEVPGGTIYTTTFDTSRFYPIVKELSIRFRRPATTDITVEINMSEEDAAKIAAVADSEGKADYGWESKLIDTTGEVVAIAQSQYQLRAIPG